MENNLNIIFRDLPSQARTIDRDWQLYILIDRLRILVAKSDLTEVETIDRFLSNLIPDRFNYNKPNVVFSSDTDQASSDIGSNEESESEISESSRCSSS